MALELQFIKYRRENNIRVTESVSSSVDCPWDRQIRLTFLLSYLSLSQATAAKYLVGTYFLWTDNCGLLYCHRARPLW